MRVLRMTVRVWLTVAVVVSYAMCLPIPPAGARSLSIDQRYTAAHGSEPVWLPVKRRGDSIIGFGSLSLPIPILVPQSFAIRRQAAVSFPKSRTQQFIQADVFFAPMAEDRVVLWLSRVPRYCPVTGGAVKASKTMSVPRSAANGKWLVSVSALSKHAGALLLFCGEMGIDQQLSLPYHHVPPQLAPWWFRRSSPVSGLKRLVYVEISESSY
jgi:hypothetical protein